MKTNFEKLKELQAYELAQVIDLLHEHAKEAASSFKEQIKVKDQVASHLTKEEIIIFIWLNQEYCETRGFKFILSNMKEYIDRETLRRNNFYYEFLAVDNQRQIVPAKNTVEQYADKYIILKPNTKYEFFAEDGAGYVQSAINAGLFDEQQVKFFNAHIVTAEELINHRSELKKKYTYVAITIPNVIKLLEVKSNE